MIPKTTLYSVALGFGVLYFFPPFQVNLHNQESTRPTHTTVPDEGTFSNTEDVFWRCVIHIILLGNISIVINVVTEYFCQWSLNKVAIYS